MSVFIGFCLACILSVGVGEGYNDVVGICRFKVDREER